jgi:hypothetical protein
MINLSAREYWCFISYRHADNREMGRMWASWLHQKLENYEVPDELVGEKNERGDTIPERIFPVFRDEDELPANADLGSPIYGALDQSKLLLVLCSPRARQSLYVNNEIAYFKRIGKSDRVIAALIDGVPNSSWNGGSEETECFPKALMHPVDEAGELQLEERAEPIAADFRLKDETEGWTSPEAYRQELEKQRVPKKQIQHLVQQYQKTCDLAFLKIVAGVIGVPLGTLTDRDTKYQLEKAKRRAKILRRVAFSMGLLTLMAIVAGGVAWVQWQEARERREEALHQRGLAQERAVIAEDRRQEAEAAQKTATQEREKAVQSENRALVNLETAKDQQYVSGIRYARATLGDKRHDLARSTLLSLPKDRRSLEWGMFMEWAGAPALQFDSALDPGKHYIGSAAVKTELSEMWKQLLKMEQLEDEDDGVKTSMSPSRNVAAIYKKYLGRRPAELQLYRLGFPEPILTLATENYGGIGGAVFSKDGSLMMVSMSAIRGLIPEQLGPLREADNPEEGVTLFFILPVPNLVPLGFIEAAITGAEDLYDYDWQSVHFTDLYLEAHAWNEHGIILNSVFRKEDDSFDYFKTELAWDVSVKDGEPMKKITEESEDYRFRSPNDLYLPKSLREGSQAMMKTYGESLAGISTVWEDPQGRVLALVHEINGAAAADVWDLSAQRRLLRLGESVEDGDDADESIFSFRDWGGAFSADGKYVMVAPVKAPKGHKISGEDGERQANNAVAIYRMQDGSLVSYLEDTEVHETARSANPKFSFSPDGKLAAYSIYEGAEPINIIHVYETETGKRIEDAGGILAYYGWTPDGQHTASVDFDGDALNLFSLSDKTKASSLQGAVVTTSGSVHSELETAISTTHDRFRMGRYLFKKGEAVPLVEMGFLATTNDLEKWVVRTGAREVIVLRGALGRSLSNNQISDLITAELMLYDHVSRLNQN